MKIVFVDPKGVWEGLNNGISYIVSNIRKEHTVIVVDFVNNQKGRIEDRLSVVKDADFVGISVKSFTLLESIMAAEVVRKLNKNTKIIAGGPHVIVDGVNLLKENEVFDMGVAGEAEITFKDILAGRTDQYLSLQRIQT